MFFIIDCAQIRAHLEAVRDPADGAGERPAAVRERDAQPRQLFQDAAEDEPADRQRRLRRHPHQPGQPVFAHALTAQHVPGVDEHRGAQRLRRFQNGIQGRVVEVPCVDVCADLDAP